MIGQHLMSIGYRYTLITLVTKLLEVFIVGRRLTFLLRGYSQRS
jgi:hypothetical protein